MVKKFETDAPLFALYGILCHSINMNNEKILKRIENEVGVDNLSHRLGEIALSDLSTLLLETTSERVEGRSPSQLLKEYQEKPQFFRPNIISQKDLLKFETLCYEAMPDEYESVQLSPITPIGVNSILSHLSQNNSLSTIRGSEVVSDVTTQLALECASRDTGGNVVKLASMGRVLRLQPFDQDRGYMQHFNLFNLCSGAKKPGENINSPMIKDHISSLLSVFEHLNKSDYMIHDLSVNITDINFVEQLIKSNGLSREEINQHSLDDDFDIFDEYKIDFPKTISNPESLSACEFNSIGLRDFTNYYKGIYRDVVVGLQDDYPNVNFNFDFDRKAGLGYYKNLCFHIYGKNDDGNIIQLADGGSVDWLAKLKNDNKQTMVISGMGAELIQRLFTNLESSE